MELLRYQFALPQLWHPVGDQYDDLDNTPQYGGAVQIMRCTIWRISLKLRITTDSLPMEIIVAWTVSGLRGLPWEPTQIQILITHVRDDYNDQFMMMKMTVKVGMATF